MIRHVVLIRFGSDTDEAENEAILQEVVAVANSLNGVRAVVYGNNISPETGMDKGYSVGFLIDFADADARDAYLVHPWHQAVGAKIIAAAEGGAAGVLVFDLALPA